MSQELRELYEGAHLPWAYRPQEHDDWGFIRTTIASDAGWCPVVAVSREIEGGKSHSEHRRDKTDPYEPLGKLIVAAVNALPSLLARIEALEAASVAAVPFMRHDGLCAAVGGYGYCSCGMEPARALLTPAQGEG